MDIVTLGAALHGAKSYTDATIAPLLGGVHYRGSVNYASNLPASPEEGDAYTVKYKGTTGTDPDGAEYVWGLDTDDNTYKWIVFAGDSYTRAEVDALLSGKQATIDSTHKLSSDLVADANSTHKFVTAAEKQTWNGKQDSVLGSWTAGQATSHSTPTSSDTVLEALRKIDNNQRLDENNISLLNVQPKLYVDDSGYIAVDYGNEN